MEYFFDDVPCDISELKDKIIKDICISVNNEQILFYCSNGDDYKMYHEQDCCESVTIEEIIGDLKDLIGFEIIEAREDSSQGKTEEGSETWTFYNISTKKGFVTIRWYGESNGYYSEQVDFEKINYKRN